MHRTPNPPDTLIPTDDLLPAGNLLNLRARITDQILRHIANLLLLKVADTDSLLAPVDVIRFEDGMARRPRRDAEFGAGVLCCEAAEEWRCQEGVGPP
jgi:hypothetical protein